ncbi:MAG: hypothetical protein HOP07_16370 [Bacteriovoracaceae bacterium]|nr:hypothetical protein [Bacteriovoracaceae bacterium]
MISKHELEQINELLLDAEKKSHSELVPMVVERSDDYPAAHFRSAIIVSFIFSLALYFSPLTIINPIYFLWIQVPGLFLGYLLGNVSWVTKLLTTKREIEIEVYQRAIEAFFEHNLHMTKRHNGVLIFVSLLEHKIQIITDSGVKAKIDQKIWDEIVNDFGQKVSKSTLSEALKEAISSAAIVLEKYFPLDGKEKSNELKNDIILDTSFRFFHS